MPMESSKKSAIEPYGDLIISHGKALISHCELIVRWMALFVNVRSIKITGGQARTFKHAYNAYGNGRRP